MRADYLLTAKAIAENINLLPKGAPLDKTVDCGVIQVGCAARTGDSRRLQTLAERIVPAEQTLADSGASASAKAQAQEAKAKLEQQIDSITAHVDVYARFFAGERRPISNRRRCAGQNQRTKSPSCAPCSARYVQSSSRAPTNKCAGPCLLDDGRRRE
jgi:hypothetical protein